MSRPIFKCKYGLIKASGIIPYTLINDNLYFLFQIKNGIYEDFGGRTESIDKSDIDTALRECSEESNKILVFDKTNISNSFYYKYSKYQTYFCYIENIDITKFGDFETINKVKRYVSWINTKDIKNIKLHPRLEWLY